MKWNDVSGASSYNLKCGTVIGINSTIFGGLTATNYADANVTNAVNYFFVVTAMGAGGESSNLLQVCAAPLPANQPTNIVVQADGRGLKLSWPPDQRADGVQVLLAGY